MEHISVNKDGVILYQDKKGYEDYWRKHQKSPIARDVWMYTPGKKPLYQRQTTFEGEDREPVWAADGKSFYYLSEENERSMFINVFPVLRQLYKSLITPSNRFVSSVWQTTVGFAMVMMEKSIR